MLSVELKGFEQLDLHLNEIMHGMSVDRGVKRILDQSAAVLLDHLRKSYLAKTDPEGVAWIPSKAGLAREAKGGPGTGYDTGNLWRSIQLFSAPPEERVIGTDVNYGPYFQGVEHSPIHRDFMVFSPTLQDLVEDIANTFLDRLVKNKG